MGKMQNSSSEERKSELTADLDVKKCQTSYLIYRIAQEKIHMYTVGQNQVNFFGNLPNIRFRPNLILAGSAKVWFRPNPILTGSVKIRFG